MHHALSGHLWGNIAIIAACGTITVACFAAMFWMIFHPGETNRDHPKYSILGDD